MIDTFLQDALVDEVRIALSGIKMMNAKDELTEINVYPQFLPAKKGKNDDEQYPYALVCFDTEEVTDLNSNIETSIYILLGICNKDLNRQGYKDVFVLANRIYQHLFRKRMIAKKYNMELPYKFVMQQEDTHPYYIGGIETKWELPVVQVEDYYS